LEGRVVPATIRVTSLLDSGAGTLRAAIEKADRAPNHDTIRFAHSLTGTITLTSALPALSTDIVISGPGPSMLTVVRSGAAGTPAFDIFSISKGAKVTISGLTITGGSAIDGGGIENSGTLSVVDATISGNSVTGSAPIGYNSGGGGIENTGVLSIVNSTVSGNSATGSSGHLAGSIGSGGGIENSGTLSVTNCTISGNSATGGSGLEESRIGAGGGIDNTGVLSIAGSTISGNSVTGGYSIYQAGGNASGGGIDNTGTLSITGCTVSGNSATGGVSYNYLIGGTHFPEPGGNGIGGGISNSGMLSVNNSTLSGNTARGGGGSSIGNGSGGGISNSDALSLANCTISGNSASDNGGGIADSGTASISFMTAADNSANSGGGIAITAGSPASVVSIDSIYQDTQGGNVSLAADGSFVSSGYNLFSDAPAISLAPTDLINTDALLGPLADNGGPTLTQPLLTGSLAIDAGTPVGGITTDQRGAPRPQATTPDIGAFQVQPPLTVVSLKRSRVRDETGAFVLTFNLPLDVGPAESLANYSLVSTGPDHQGRAIPIRSARYDATSQTVTLRLRRQIPLSDTYRLTATGAPPGGLTTTVGAYLAGAGTGQPGTDYVTVITPNSLGPPVQ
jgi:hypothetical protein